MVDFVTRDEESAPRVHDRVALIPNVTSGMNAVVGGHARTSSRITRHGLVFYCVSVYSYMHRHFSSSLIFTYQTIHLAVLISK